MKMVKVTWRDSHRYTYQMDRDDEVTVTEIETVGWLVRKQNKDLVIAQDYIEGDIRGVIVIPHENVLKVTYLFGSVIPHAHRSREEAIWVQMSELR